MSSLNEVNLRGNIVLLTPKASDNEQLPENHDFNQEIPYDDEVPF